MVETAVIVVLLVALSISLLFLFLKKDVGLTRLTEGVLAKEKQLHAAIEGLSDGVVVMDKVFKVVVANPAVFSILQLNHPLDTSDFNIFYIVNNFDKSYRLDEAVADVFERGHSRTLHEVKYNSKLLSITVFPVRIKGVILGAGLVFHDRSEEQELQKLRDDFTAMIVHELRSPLALISGTSNLLMRRSGELSHEQVTEMLGSVKSSTDDLLGMVDEILDAAKAQSGKFEIQKAANDINKLIEKESKYFSGLATEHNIKFNLNLNTSIIHFPFDYLRISQVLSNLLSNAFKFTQEGYICVKSDLQNGDAIVSVEDTGVGVQDKDKGRIFEKFVQARFQGVRAEKGTGLGLVIAKGIVEAHGGRIWVEDNHPRGTRFVFTLPIS